MSALVINNIQVNLVSKDGKVFATSLDVAKVFEKEHRRVLQDIREMSERAQHNFVQSSYINSQNREMPMYEMNRDGFTFLVMGFTGEKAENFKLDFIDGFNKMENALREQQKSSPLQILEQMFQVAKEHDNRLEALEKTKRLEGWQEKRLKDAVNQKVFSLSNGEKDLSPLYRAVWRLVKSRFTVPRYSEIPSIEFDQAIDFVNRIRVIDLIQSFDYSKSA